MPITNAARARAAGPSPCAARARYFVNENGFSFELPPVPVRQFLAERDAAFAPDTPTGAIALDASDALRTAYPATTPTLLCRYLRIRAGERLHTALAASAEICYVMRGNGESRNRGDGIEWSEGDVFSFPGGGETVHVSGRSECLLFMVTNEPLLAFERLRPPADGRAAFDATHWPAADIEREFESVYRRPITDNTTGHAVQFTSERLGPGPLTAPSINVSINTLAAGCNQRPHRHNGVAVTLAIQGEAVHSMIDGRRVDWSDGAAQITPATSMHSHHNRGTRRMRSLVIQDEGLHYYTRTPGFSFD